LREDLKPFLAMLIFNDKFIIYRLNEGIEPFLFSQTVCEECINGDKFKRQSAFFLKKDIF
jgi:hypothetical protein